MMIHGYSRQIMSLADVVLLVLSEQMPRNLFGPMTSMTYSRKVGVVASGAIMVEIR